MVSHTYNSKLDPDYSAMLSRQIIDSLLRKKMRYNGIVITDDINIKGITTNYTFEQVMALTINAGVDLIIISGAIKEVNDHGAEDIIATILSLVQQGSIPSQRIDEAYECTQTL